MTPTSPPATSSARAAPCGAATTRTTRARTRTPGNLRARFSGLDPDENRQLLAGNAAALYDFDLEALAPLAAEIGPTVAEVGTPIDDVPTKTLERLSGDMGAKAIK